MSARADTDSSHKQSVASVRAELISEAFRLAKDADSAEDIVQDALTSVFARFQRLDEVPRAYLRKAVRNTALNAARREERRRRMTSRFELEASGSRNPDLLMRIDAHRMWRTMLRELEQLPDRSQTIARMHWIDGCSCMQISNELRVSVKSVEKRVHYARQRLVASIYERGDPSGSAGK